MAENQTCALVLHRRPYGETSLIVDFFCQQGGRISALCKGVRGSKSGKQGERKSLLQPFQPLMVVLRGRHELKTLAQVEAFQSPYLLNGHPLFAAFYLNEILNRLLPKEVTLPEVFDLYLASLLRLAQGDALEAVLREFELGLLAQLGYGIDWTTDGQSAHAIEPQKYYTYVNELGFVEDPLPNHTANRFLGETLLAINDFHWTEASLRCAKRVTRMALSPILGEKPLKSRELFKTMEKSQ